MVEERRECVAEQGKLVRVRSGATTVAPCIANFVTPRYHHRCQTTVESLPSHRRCARAAIKPRATRCEERATEQREEREKALQSSFCRYCSLCHHRLWSSPLPESRAEVGKEAIFPMVLQSPVTVLLLLRFVFFFLNCFGNAAIISQLGQHHPHCSDPNFPNFKTGLLKLRLVM
ncbi:uncharacterized protein LOC107465718 isoform X1 [Arachis duranensis]|uniref:Uncharacterized protein LOC107465718 isoform X1 n=1 Tax=Arachis duranensis TaxID=130453 RepID=A0A6P5MSJ7_ARADU|nr:uncharacterized protein LOC107465718 isoform X1 [Arachis duranensis]